MLPFAVCCLRMSWCPELFFQPVLMPWIVFPTRLDVLNSFSNLTWGPELFFQPVLMSWIVFPTWLDVLNCFSNLSWCPQLTPWYKHPGWQGVEKIGSSLSACEEWPFTTVCFLRMIFSSRLSQCLDVPDLPDEDWPSSVVCFLRMIVWSLTAGFLDVLMFQTYLMKTDHPLLFISSEWSYDL